MWPEQAKVLQYKVIRNGGMQSYWWSVSPGEKQRWVAGLKCWMLSMRVVHPAWMELTSHVRVRAKTTDLQVHAGPSLLRLIGMFDRARRARFHNIFDIIHAF